MLTVYLRTSRTVAVSDVIKIPNYYQSKSEILMLPHRGAFDFAFSASISDVRRPFLHQISASYGEVEGRTVLDAGCIACKCEHVRSLGASHDEIKPPYTFRRRLAPLHPRRVGTERRSSILYSTTEHSRLKATLQVIQPVLV